MVRLKNYFTKWVELSEVEKSFDGAVELMVREQFANACSQDLSVYLNEKSPKTLDELVILAEQYLMAHDKLSSKDVMARLGDTCRFGRGKSPESFRAVVRCYRCGGEGHQAVECVPRMPEGIVEMDNKEEEFSATDVEFLDMKLETAVLRCVINRLKRASHRSRYRQRYRCVCRHDYVRVFTHKKSGLAVT